MDQAPPPLAMARYLEVFNEPRPRILAVMCVLHLITVAMPIFTANDRNSVTLASVLPPIAWICIWLSIIARQYLCVWACDLLHHIRVSLSPRPATAHTPRPFTRAFYAPVETLPIPPADVTPEDRPVTVISPVQEEVSAPSASNIPPIDPEQRGESLVYWADSFAWVTCRYSG